MIVEFNGKRPKVDAAAFIVDTAMVIGDVEIGPGTNIWYYTVVRGDLNYIRIGANCNIQDACVLHIVKDLHPLVLEDAVVLGHRVVAHGCTIGRGSLIGMGAVVLNGAEVGAESIIGAGSVVAPGTIIPPRSLAVGVPARVVRGITDDDVRLIEGTVDEYLDLKAAYGDQR